MASTPLPLNSEFLFRMVLHAGQPHMEAAGAAEVLRVIPVTGGTFEGPKMKGALVPGTTADWLRVEADGSARVDVRLVMRTDKGQTFYMSYSGLRNGPADVLAKLGKEDVDPSSYYFRIAIRFETSDPELAWMNRVIAVGVGQRPPEGPTYDIYVIR